MTDGLSGVISQLESQKAAIDKALAALREVESGNGVGVLPSENPALPATRKGGMSPEGKQRLIAALKRRWAAKKAAAGSAAPAVAPAVAKSGGMTQDGRRRLAAAMKRRWAVKRAASAVKKSARKKAA